MSGKARPAAQRHQRVGQLAFSGISQPIVEYETAGKGRRRQRLVNETDLMRLSAELLEGMNRPSFIPVGAADQRKYDRSKASM